MRENKSRRSIPEEDWEQAVVYAGSEIRRTLSNPHWWQKSAQDVLEYLVRRGEGADAQELEYILELLRLYGSGVARIDRPNGQRRNRSPLNRRADVTALAAIATAEIFGVAMGRNLQPSHARSASERSAIDAAVAAAAREGIDVTFQAVSKAVTRWRRNHREVGKLGLTKSNDTEGRIGNALPELCSRKERR